MFLKIVFVIILIILAIAERLWFDLGPNVELVTTATILTSIYLGKEYAIIVPLLILGFSDMFLGNTNIMLFTWSAFIVEGLFTWWLARRVKFNNRKIISKLFCISGFGVGASLWFFLWTNFGVWFLDSWGMYPKTLSGLTLCYIAGLPFLKLNLLGNIIFIITASLMLELPSWLKNLCFKRKPLLSRI